MFARTVQLDRDDNLAPKTLEALDRRTKNKLTHPKVITPGATRLSCSLTTERLGRDRVS
jgi:hypothetical protein